MRPLRLMPAARAAALCARRSRRTLQGLRLCGVLFAPVMWAAGLTVCAKEQAAQAAGRPGYIRLCVQAAEQLTLAHFKAQYTAGGKTNDGRAKLAAKIRHAKFMKDFRAGKIRFHESSKEGMAYLKSITANPDDPADLELISAFDPDNNLCERNRDGRLIPFSSPFEFGMQAVKQCRDRAGGIAHDDEVTDLWKGHEHMLPRQAARDTQERRTS